MANERHGTTPVQSRSGTLADDVCIGSAVVRETQWVI